MADPKRLTFATSRLRMAATAAVCLGALLVGLWVIGESDDPILSGWSWIGVWFLGLGVVLALWQVRRPSQLNLTPQGFEITGVFGTGLIPWTDVEAFFVHSETDSPKGHGDVPPHAAWRLTETSTARDRLLSRINRAGLEGVVDGTVPRHLGGSPQEAVDLLESWRVRYS